LLVMEVLPCSGFLISRAHCLWDVVGKILGRPSAPSELMASGVVGDWLGRDCYFYNNRFK